MAAPSFGEKLDAAQARSQSWLCVGLDTDPSKIPAALRGKSDAVVAFNRSIIQATQDVVCAYKPNLAFYLAQGSAGIDALTETCSAIPREIPIILDAKFGDIESSARGYARFAFEHLGADAVTASPYLGKDALAPFLEYGGRAIFVLCHTSNAGASDLQDVLIATDKAEVAQQPLYLRVAQLASELQGKADVGMVVGATWPTQLRDARLANASAVLLIPGVGAQGGSLSEAVRYGVNSTGVGPLINASRSILYASSADDYAEAARLVALKTRDEMNTLREKL